MKPSQEPTTSEQDQADFEQNLIKVEESLQSLKARYTQVKTAQQTQAELKQRLARLQLEKEKIKEQLENLEVELESRLLTWSSQSEIFWQIVRFLGLGLVIGFALKALID